MNSDKTLKALGLEQSELFDQYDNLLSVKLEDRLKETDKTISFLTNQLDKHQSHLDNHLNTAPDMTTTVWGWITGGLNFITFNFFDWWTDGAISSFETQKLVAQEKHNILTRKLTKNIDQAISLLNKQKNLVKSSSAELKSLIKENSEEFSSKFEGKVQSLIYSSKEDEKLGYTTVDFYDNNQDAMAFEGFKSKKPLEMHLEDSFDGWGEPATQITHSYKNGDKAALKTELSLIDEFLKNREKLDEFLQTKYRKAGLELTHYGNNHTRLESFVKAFNKRIDNIEKNKQTILTRSK